MRLARARSARRSRWASSTTCFPLYLKNVTSLRVGTSFVFVLIVLVWFYALALILLAGAVVNELRFEARADARLKPRAEPPMKAVTPIQSRPSVMRIRPALLRASARPSSACSCSPPPTFAADGRRTPLSLEDGAKESAQAVGTAGGSLVRTIVGLAVVIGVIYGLYWVLKQVKSSREEKRRRQRPGARSRRCRSAATARCSSCAPVARSC